MKVKEIAMRDSPLVDAGSVSFWQLPEFPQSDFPNLPHPHVTQGRLVKEADNMHLYSSFFSVMEEEKEVKKEDEIKEEKGKGKKEIFTLLPHFLSFPSLTNTGSFLKKCHHRWR